MKTTNTIPTNNNICECSKEGQKIKTCTHNIKNKCTNIHSNCAFKITNI